MRSDPRVVPNPTVGLRYAMASVLFALLAVELQGPGWLLLWPAVSSAVVAVSYLHLGAAIYHKRRGRVPFFPALLLTPTRLGQWLSWIYYRKHTTLCSEVYPGLYLGRLPAADEVDTLIRAGVTRVLDCTSEFSVPASLLSLTYLNLPIPDLTAPTRSQLQRGVWFIQEGLAAGETLYVHCKVGYSRSGAVVGAFLLASGTCTTPEDTFQRLEEKRPGIILRPEARQAIRCFFGPTPSRQS